MLEIVVVLFIIGLVTFFAIAGLSSRGSDQLTEREARRLHELALLASEHAIIYGEDIGIATSETDYVFLIYDVDNDAWVPAPDDIFRLRSVSEPLQLAMLVEDLSIERDDSDDEDKLLPSALFLSTGEVTPFELRIRNTEQRIYYRLAGDETGTLTLDRINEDQFSAVRAKRLPA